MARRVKVKLQDTVPARVVFIDPNASDGATLGTNLFMADGSIGTPASVRTWLGVSLAQDPRSPPSAASGVNHHRMLQGLTLGDDHPQYTQWAQEETITQSWDWTIGGVQQWDIDPNRVFQTIPLISRISISAERRSVFQMVRGDGLGLDGGVEIVLFDEVTPGNDTGAQLGIWEGSNATAYTYPPFATGSGYRWLLAGDVDSEGDMIFYSHVASAVGTEIYRHKRNSAQMLFAGGSPSAPTISFNNGANAGMYSPSAGIIRFATSGIQRVSITDTGTDFSLPLRSANGSAAAPGYSFTNDTNTGLHWLSADTLGIAAGGTTRLTLNTVSFISTLPWRGPDGTVGAPAVSFSGDTDVGLYRVTANVLGLAGSVAVRLAGDNQQLQLGAGQDLLLYHDGTDSKITNNTGRLDLASAGTITVNKPLRLQGYTVATLPAGVAGDTAYVTDAAAPAYGAAAVGGGAVVVPVFYNGAAWITA